MILAISRILLAAGVLLWLPTAAVAAPSETEIEPVKRAVTALIEDERESEHIPGLSLALVDEHGIVWAAGFGYADVEKRVPARAETIYPVGALTMPLTAAAVMQLTEQRAIELDLPIGKYLPEFSLESRFASGAPITPRNLLTHHAGLPAARFKGIWTPQPLAELVASLKDEHAAYPPDHVHDPSDLGYDVLGRLIEVKTGQEFTRAMEERLLAPLGMRASSFARAGVDRTLLAVSYWHGKKELEALAARDTPAVGLYSSAVELGRFLTMLLRDGELEGRRVLSARSVAEMLRPQNERVALDLDNRVGLGLRLSGVRLDRADRIAWQSDTSLTGRGRILIAPDQKLGVVVIANSSTGSRLIERVSTRLLETALDARATEPPEPRPHAAAPAVPPPTPDELNGHYAGLLGLIRVTAEEERVRANVLGKTLALEPEPDGRLSVGYRLLGFIPIPIKVLKEVRVQPMRIAGRDLMLLHYKDQRFRLADRIEPEPLPEAWRARLGEYEPAERDLLLDLIELHALELRYEEGFLHFYYRLPGWFGLAARVPVKPVSDTALAIQGNGWLMGETIEVVRRGDEERLRYSGYELKRVAR